MISPSAIRLLNLGPTAWARTQSVYRATAELLPANSHGAVIFGQPLHPYLTHGVQQFASETFDLAECERLGLPVVRRPFPGGAEYCDVNQLLFQWVLPVNADSRKVAAGMLSALSELGIAAESTGSQFTVKGARIGAVTGGRYESATVLLGCLYFSYDPAPLAQATRNAQAETVTTLWAEAPRPFPPDAVQDTLIEHFSRAVGRPIERDKPRVQETRRAKQIERELLGIEDDASEEDNGSGDLQY
ncbi:MAG TPA: hypothetical protein VJL59_15650 [Anaerolineales bacterium]|nr:hypothetical protein [Anaerolineales bacterium]